VEQTDCMTLGEGESKNYLLGRVLGVANLFAAVRQVCRDHELKLEIR
jgi:hypothetical protein